ncbi:MAG: hypothetical protein KKI02_02220 [Planctomycetes bacterium]|nr:hypothetical protein [Planctomycetota bacterium]
MRDGVLRCPVRWIARGGAAVLLLVLCPGGCPFTTLIAGGTSLDESGNDTFETATPVTLDGEGQAQFTGTIDGADNADIYDLGVLAPGDRLFVDVWTTSGNLDAMAAVFDEREYLLAFNDDRTPDASNLNPLIDVIVPGPEGRYYLGVAPYAGSESSGDYRVVIRVTRAVGILDPEPQTVFLNWAGGENIRIDNVGVFNVDPFDAADLGPYAGRTAEMKDAIQDVIADRYEGFDLVLLNSDDHGLPADPHSTVYFGGRERSAFAVAEQIDTFNADQTDNAIIFTDSFRDAFSITPGLGQMATAIGNTTAHEIGHLLGLAHTQDCVGLMDTTCSNDALLREQVFKLSPLDDSTFPVGMQNALELIEWAIGLAGL